MEDPAMFKAAFELVQQLLTERVIRAGHDVSDGGLVTAVLEMAFAGNCGLRVDLPNPTGDALGALFAEELGMVLEVAEADADGVAARFSAVGVPCHSIGSALTGSRAVSVSVGGEEHVAGDVGELRDVWEATSFKLEREQSAGGCVDQEEAGLRARQDPQWRVTFEPGFTSGSMLAAPDKVKVAVVREEGSNGDREMAAALYAGGFQPADVTMSDLLSGNASLADFQGCVFVGGFSYADVMESSRGWAGTIKFNEGLQRQFKEFYARPDTFSLGVCNGCQLMALLGWVGDDGDGGGGDGATALADSALHLGHNDSGRFESRFAHVKIDQSPSIMLSGMEGSVLGVWCAHGEGKFTFNDEALRGAVEGAGLVPIRYCDSSGIPTEVYPANPNGSPGGIAGLCSPDGRHLAMMPHPERCFLGWQLPWSPSSAAFEPAGPGPWLKMFQNAREWCERSRPG
jgi:phosphoribosylformylglycinamidine synthase